VEWFLSTITRRCSVTSVSSLQVILYTTDASCDGLCEEQADRASELLSEKTNGYFQFKSPGHYEKGNVRTKSLVCRKFDRRSTHLENGRLPDRDHAQLRTVPVYKFSAFLISESRVSSNICLNAMWFSIPTFITKISPTLMFKGFNAIFLVVTWKGCSTTCEVTTSKTSIIVK
jgi:hypothetical protein